MPMTRNMDEVFAALARSPFRRRFALGQREVDYLQRKGLQTVLEHGRDFITTRLAPAQPPNDGRQTPWRNHPVFIAQHATGTCCRKCLAKWHGVPAGRELTDQEQHYILTVIERWLRQSGSSV